MRAALLLAVAVAIAVAALEAPAARAADCGDVPANGACEDVTTLVWCDGGDLRRVTCPGSEICVTHDLFDGAPGCIAPGQTECGEGITPAGQCTPSNSVVWCGEDGVPRNEPCAVGTLCSWDDTNGWYDCLNDTGSGPRGRPTDGADAAGGDAAQADANGATSGRGDQDLGPDEDLAPDDGAPGPTTGPTPALAFETSPDTVSPGGGCAASSSRPALGWLLAALVCVALRRRRSDLRAAPTA